MVPAMLFQTVDWRDVVGGHPTLTILWAHFTPFSILVVAEYAEFLTWTQEDNMVMKFGLKSPLGAFMLKSFYNLFCRFYLLGFIFK